MIPARRAGAAHHGAVRVGPEASRSHHPSGVPWAARGQPRASAACGRDVWPVGPGALMGWLGLACTTCNEEVQAGILGPDFPSALAGVSTPFLVAVALALLLGRCVEEAGWKA